ncbi:MAG: hypothetical protein NTX71_11040 [Candidatus Aureabacteria bacterium]|nr:hypothetical protein [Candidatus Auribacterota bacterium]
MVKSNAKRTLAALLAVVVCAVIAAGVYVFPRRAVPSMFDLVPAERMVACVRVRGLASVWRGCEGSSFVKNVREGGIYPMDEIRAGDERFTKVWERLDNPYWPEVLGRDCVLALYLDRGMLSGAVWSRIGFKTRCFHLWEHCRARLRFGREKKLESRREGMLGVTTVMDLKRKTPRFSYTLIGDLAVATTGSGGEFWKRIDSLMAGRERGALTLFGKGTAAERPHGERPGGGFFADLQELSDYLDTRADALPSAGAAEAWARMRDLREWLREIAGGWRRLRGTFYLEGNRLGTEVSILAREEAAVKELRGASRREAVADPLTRLMEHRGLLYAGSRYDPQGLLGQFRRRSGAEAIEFVRRGGTTVFPADHFSLSWLGNDCSLLLYQDENGMVHAAVSLLVSDRLLARERIGRFLNLAHGARIRLVGRDGRQMACTKKPLDVELKRHEGEPYCLVETGDPIERLYKPTLAMYGDRLLIATADSILGELDGEKAPSPQSWMAPAQAHFMVRGSAAARAAASLTQILSIVTPFVERQAEREMLARARQLLGAMEWLAPVREGWATAIREGNEIRVRGGAQFADVGSR